MSLINNNGFSSASNYNVPPPPPMPQYNLMAATNNSNPLGNRRLATRTWSNLGSYQTGPSTFSQTTTTSALPVAQQTTTYLPQSTVLASTAPAVVSTQGMLPAPINDGRRYARLTGQKFGSRKARGQLVQPINGTGLQTLPAGIPVEGLTAANQPLAGGRRSRGGRRAGRGLNANSTAFQPTLLSQTYGQQQILPMQQTIIPAQQTFVSAAPATQFVSAPTQIVSAAPAVIAQPATLGMLPAPINDGRRYARLTGQKAGSRRARRHLVQPLNGSGLQTLPAGIPVEGLTAANQSVLSGGRRSRRSNRGAANNGSYVSLANGSSTSTPFTQGGISSSAPLAAAPLSTGYASTVPLSSGFVSAPLATTTLASAPLLASGSNLSALPAPHLAQIPLGATKVTRAQRRAARTGAGNGRAGRRGRNMVAQNTVAAPLVTGVPLMATSNLQPMQSTFIKQEPVFLGQPSMVGTPIF